MENIIKHFSDYEITKLKGDGSERAFFRLAKDKNNLILMINSDKTSNQKYLAAYNKYKNLNLPIAEILESSLEEGFILFEDLGDLHLREELNKNFSIDYLKSAIDIILKLQFSDSQKVDYEYSFDYDTFTFESNYAFLNYCEKYKNKHHLKDKYDVYFQNINRIMSQASNYLTHRDYHPDNIMIYKNKIYLIDYQDTRLGPFTYDLVSLLYDRSTLSFTQATELKNYFASKIASTHKISKDEFEYLFTINSIQRLFKILGSFAYLSEAKSNLEYLKFIPQTLSYLDHEIKNSPFSSELKELVKDLS